MVLLAWLCRVLPLEGLPSGLREACGILRSLLYLSLFAGWGVSLYNRTVHPQVRRLLLNVDLLMLFWILVRTLRFQLNTPPGMDRMLWYLYYAPMLGIYAVLYSFHFPLIKQFLGDMTIVHCLMTVPAAGWPT